MGDVESESEGHGEKNPTVGQECGDVESESEGGRGRD